jgi:hypothetical protein
LPHKNERVELEMQIMKYKRLERTQTDDLTQVRMNSLIAELQRKLREIDE